MIKLIISILIIVGYITMVLHLAFKEIYRPMGFRYTKQGSLFYIEVKRLKKWKKVKNLKELQKLHKDAICYPIYFKKDAISTCEYLKKMWC